MDKKLRILFRTGGGRKRDKELGLGHIFRCSNLAKFLDTKQIYFLLEDFGGAKNILNSLGYNDVSIIKKYSIEKDLEQTKKMIKNLKIDVVIIDRYKIDPIYVKKIRKYVKTVVISDLKKIAFNADLVVSGFIGYENQIYHNRYDTKCLLGPKYQILNKKFITDNKRKRKTYDFLATFGGNDENNINKLILEVISKENIVINNGKVILGPITKINKNIMNYIKNKKIELVKESHNIFSDISKTQLGFCSGGITSYEFACLKVPFVIICQVKHQLKTAKEWEKKGFAINLGMPNNRTSKKIKEIFKKRSNLGLIQNKKIIDGKGGLRVKREIYQLFN